MSTAPTHPKPAQAKPAQPGATPSRRSPWLPTRRAWWVIGAAFAAGLLLFTLLWWSKRDEFEFYRAGDPHGEIAGQAFDPLPAPLPADTDAVSGLDEAQREDTRNSRLDQHTPAPVDPAAAPAPGTPGTQTPTPATTANASLPEAISRPMPAYPRDALRQGQEGEVILQVDVDAEGKPTAVEVVSSSRYRSLDRAAAAAVRRWRFRPAMQDGVAVPGRIQQSIRFTPEN